MQTLQFPTYAFRFKKIGNKTAIYDTVRRKFIILTPEEWVRQHVVHYLIAEKKYPKSWINIEKEFKINNQSKRYDIVVFYPDGTIFLLVECKASQIQISQNTFDQTARYNMLLKSKYLMVTNGLCHYVYQSDHQNNAYVFLPELPSLTHTTK